MVTPSTKKQADGKSNAGAIVDSFKKRINASIKKFKGHVIHAWMKDFEDQYLKTFQVIVNVKEPKEVVNAVAKRMGDYEYTEQILILVKYEPSEKFTVLATQTAVEKEYAEFKKWKKLHKGVE